jgi:hypothetical protein
MATTTLDPRNPIFLQVDDAQVTTTGGAQTVNLTPAAGGALLAENNLDDLDSAADARANLGATTLGEDIFTAATASAVRSLIGVSIVVLSATCYVAATTAGVTYVPVPTGWTGTVTSIRAVNSADPGGLLSFTSAIGPSGGAFVPITNGTFTVPDTTVAGTAVVASPTAARSVTGGTSVIEIAWDNGAANAINVGVVIEITRT